MEKPKDKPMKDQKQKSKMSPRVEQVIAAATSMDSHYDPNGSYTGRPLDGDYPTQDADDL